MYCTMPEAGVTKNSNVSDFNFNLPNILFFLHILMGQLLFFVFVFWVSVLDCMHVHVYTGIL